eukprot:s1614_g20.t1
MPTLTPRFRSDGDSQGRRYESPQNPIASTECPNRVEEQEYSNCCRRDFTTSESTLWAEYGINFDSLSHEEEIEIASEGRSIGVPSLWRPALVPRSSPSSALKLPTCQNELFPPPRPRQCVQGTGSDRHRYRQTMSHTPNFEA